MIIQSKIIWEDVKFRSVTKYAEMMLQNKALVSEIDP